jgi:hypothetical protein
MIKISKKNFLAFLILCLLSNFSYANRSVGEIDDTQVTQVQKRVEERNFNFFAFGPAWFLEKDTKNLSYLFELGRLWNVHPSAALRARLNFVGDFSDHNYFTNTAVGIVFYYNSGDFSPYLATDFGLGTDFRDSFGFSFLGAFGITLFRAASAHFFIEPNFQMVLNGNYPKALGIKVGVSY